MHGKTLNIAPKADKANSMNVKTDFQTSDFENKIEASVQERKAFSKQVIKNNISTVAR